MKNWVQFLSDAGAIPHLYGEAPDLSRVWLSRLSMSDNPACEIALHTAELPQSKPVRWGQFNVVVIEFGLTQLETVLVEGWPWQRFVEMSFSRKQDGIAVDLVGPELKISIQCAYVDVTRVHGYLCEEQWLNEFNKPPEAQ